MWLIEIPKDIIVVYIYSIVYKMQVSIKDNSSFLIIKI